MPPYDHRRAPGKSLLQGPRARRFVISEVPLYGSILKLRTLESGS